MPVIFGYIENLRTRVDYMELSLRERREGRTKGGKEAGREREQFNSKPREWHGMRERYVHVLGFLWL